MTDHPATITYNNGSPQFNPAVGVQNLDENDTVTVTLAGFPSGSTISTVDFYGNTTSISGTDSKNTNNNFGSWTRAGGNGSGLNNIYSCSSSSNTVVEIKDTENPGEGNVDKHWYGIAGAIGTGGTWSVDPELINKGKS